jgi:dolichol-phosphate mannosyltransferase
MAEIDRTKCCVLIATYNEKDTIEKLLNKINYNCGLPALIVDDNSPDGTGMLAASFPYTTVLSRKGKLGIASAYKEGMEYLLKLNKYDYIIQMDAGMTHNPDDTVKMLEKAVNEEADLVLSSRMIHKQKIQSYRTILSKSARLLMKIIGIHQNDVTSGFRCWKTSFLKQIPFSLITAKGFAFQLQFLYYAVLQKAKIVEYPIEYKLTNSSLNWKIVKEAFQVWCKLFYLTYLKKGEKKTCTL